MNPKISIIMPVYNAEKYLSEMIDSIITQTFTDFELIALNDGSTDSSLSILHDYSKKDSRIIVIDKPNTGVSDTRNIGLGNAQGEYVCFVDADDMLSNKYLSDMYEIASEKHADMVLCKYCTFRNKLKFSSTDLHAKKILSSNEILELGLMTSSCVKLILKSRVEDNRIRFSDTLSYGEDLFFCWKVFLTCKNVWLVDKTMYAYRMTGRGATSRLHKNLYENYSLAFSDLKLFAHSVGIEKDLEFDIYFTKRIPSFILMTVREKIAFKKKIKRVDYILSDSTIKYVLCDYWNELTGNMNAEEIRIYQWAKDRRIKKLLMTGYFREFKLKAKRILFLPK